MLSDYTPVLIQVLIALGLGLGILFASWVFGQRAKQTKTKNSAYECGMLPEGKQHPRFSVKFYVAAMLFILFDIEVVFLIPWVLVYREFLAANIAIFLPGFFFLIVLTLGLWYELRKGALVWDR